MQLAHLQQMVLQLGQQALRKQRLIDLLHPHHAALNRRQHLLLQQADLLFSVGMLNPGAAQRPAGMTPQDSFNRLLGGLQHQEWILLR